MFASHGLTQADMIALSGMWPVNEPICYAKRHAFIKNWHSTFIIPDLKQDKPTHRDADKGPGHHGF